MSEVINWFNRDRDYYAVFGASMFDDDMNNWAGQPTLEEFLDMVADSWDTHFDKDNMPVNGGHYVYFQEVEKYRIRTSESGYNQQHMFIQEWDAEDSEAFLSDFQDIISEHWQKPWVCGFGHTTSEAYYEIVWRKYNV